MKARFVTALFLSGSLALLLPAQAPGARAQGAQAPSGSTATGPASDPADTGLRYDPTDGTFTEAPPPERGWQAFADLLARAAPSVDTAPRLTPAEVARHVARLIDTGKAQAALDIIRKQAATREKAGTIGTDVQLEYQRARALAALGRHDEAVAVWQHMTTEYPELPEPWNALAIEYVRQGQPQRALEALDMALVSDPDFAPALENRGHVQMQLAQESFQRARAAARGDTP